MLAEHVPPQGVRAEGVRQAGGQQLVFHAHLQGVVRRQPGGEDGHEDDGQQNAPYNGQLDILFSAQRHGSPPCTRIFGLTRM